MSDEAIGVLADLLADPDGDDHEYRSWFDYVSNALAKNPQIAEAIDIGLSVQRVLLRIPDTDR